MIDAALSYAQTGWKVLPLRPRGKRPQGLLAPHGKDDATDDPAVIGRWWTLEPAANIGINCEASGIVAFDVDPRDGGDDHLHDLEAELGALPATVENLSGGGGQHLLFQNPGGSFVGRLAPGVEIKCKHLLVLPPSVHRDTGRRYEWSVDGHPDEVPLAQLPTAWLDRARDHRPEHHHRPGPTDDFLAARPPVEYVRLLAGLEPGRDGKVRCPFHEDRTPSLHVYEERGWYCYGCRRGGGIYEFAALIGGYELPLRGTAFLTVQSALLEFYEERLVA